MTRWLPGCVGSETSYARLQKDSAQSVAWPARSVTRLSESVTRHVRGSAPSGRILEPRWPKGWRLRASLPGWARSSPRCRGLFRLRVMSTISCVLPSGWFSMTWGWRGRRKLAHLRPVPWISWRGWASLRTPFTPGSPKPLLLPTLIMIRKLTWR